MTDQDQSQNDQTGAAQGDDAQAGKQGGYSVTDLPEGATPDPLGDASLSPRERAGASDTDGQ